MTVILSDKCWDLYVLELPLLVTGHDLEATVMYLVYF